MKLKRRVKKLKADCRRLLVSSDIRIYLLLLAYVEYFIRPNNGNNVTLSLRLPSLIISRWKDVFYSMIFIFRDMYTLSVRGLLLVHLSWFQPKRCWNCDRKKSYSYAQKVETHGKLQSLENPPIWKALYNIHRIGIGSFIKSQLNFILFHWYILTGFLIYVAQLHFIANKK